MARSWYHGYSVGKLQVEWSDFCVQFTARFGALEEELLYDSFKQLRQTSTVEHYFGLFERLMEQLKGRMPSLTEEFFVESFMGGLQKDIKEVVRLVETNSVDQAYKKARYYNEFKSRSTYKDRHQRRGILETNK